MDTHLERIRRVEIYQVQQFFPAGSRVLEIGGGNGFQARILSSWGCNVSSIDLEQRKTPVKQYHFVKEYDGEKFPTETNSVDRVYSSSVLEHLSNLSGILSEIHRVLKPDGLAIHILPTATWRLWTSIAHYGHIFQRLITYHRPQNNLLNGNSFSKLKNAYGWGMVGKILFAGPHGASRCAASELISFRKSRWIKTFARNGFQIERIATNGLFYTGYELFPNLSVQNRQTLARALGSSCHIFITTRTR